MLTSMSRSPHSTVRHLPGLDQRPETGPLRFGEDWTGVFLRGDAALPMASALSALLERATSREPVDPFSLMTCQGLRDILISCDERLPADAPAPRSGEDVPTTERVPHIPLAVVLAVLRNMRSTIGTMLASNDAWHIAENQARLVARVHEISGDTWVDEHGVVAQLVAEICRVSSPAYQVPAALGYCKNPLL